MDQLPHQAQLYFAPTLGGCDVDNRHVSLRLCLGVRKRIEWNDHTGMECT